MEDRSSGMAYEKGKKNPKTANQEFCIQQNYTKSEGEIKTFIDKQKL